MDAVYRVGNGLLRQLLDVLGEALAPMRRQIEKAQSLAWRLTMIGLKFWLFMFLLIAALCWMVFVATALYFWLYQTYVPKMYHHVPVHFDFTHTEFGPYAYSDLSNPQFAFTNFSALAAHPPPPLHLLAADQAYDIELHLVLPDSDSNRQLRMLNVKADVLHRRVTATAASGDAHSGSADAEHNSAPAAHPAASPVPLHTDAHHPPHSAPPPLPQRQRYVEFEHQQHAAAAEAVSLSSKAAHVKAQQSQSHAHPHQHPQPRVSHTLLATSLRSFTPPYRSLVARIGSAVFWLLPNVLFGWSPDATHRLTVPLFEQFVEHQHFPSDLIRLHLLPAAHAVDLHLYSAHLSFHTRLRGLTYVMYSWFLSSAAVGITALVLLQALLSAVLCLWLYTCCKLGAENDADAQAARAADAAGANGNGNSNGSGSDPFRRSPSPATDALTATPNPSDAAAAPAAAVAAAGPEVDRKTPAEMNRSQPPRARSRGPQRPAPSAPSPTVPSRSLAPSAPSGSAADAGATPSAATGAAVQGRSRSRTPRQAKDSPSAADADAAGDAAGGAAASDADATLKRRHAAAAASS